MRIRNDAEKDRLADMVTAMTETCSRMLEEIVDVPVDVVLIATLPDEAVCAAMVTRGSTRGETLELIRSLLAKMEGGGDDDD